MNETTSIQQPTIHYTYTSTEATGTNWLPPPFSLDKPLGLSYLFIRRDIEHGRARFRLLHGEGDEGVDQLDGRIETAAVAGVIVFVTAIQSRVNLSLVIFAHMHGNVEMSGVAVRQTAEGHHVTVEVFRLHA